MEGLTIDGVSSFLRENGLPEVLIQTLSGKSTCTIAILSFQIYLSRRYVCGSDYCLAWLGMVCVCMCVCVRARLWETDDAA